MVARLLRLLTWPFRAVIWLTRGVFWLGLAVLVLPFEWLFARWVRMAVAIAVALMAVGVLRPDLLPDAEVVGGAMDSAGRWLWERANRRSAPPTATEPTPTPGGPGPGAAADRPLRFATFNINGYGARRTPQDEARAVQLLRELDADIIALQEVGDFLKLGPLAGAISGGARRYNWLATTCGGTGEQRLAFLFDTGRVGSQGAAELPAPRLVGAEQPCAPTRPLLLAGFDAGGRRFDAINVHLPAFERGAPERRERVRELAGIIRVRRSSGVRDFLVLGDFNAQDAEERYVLGLMLDEVGVHIATGPPCSAYWQRPPRSGRFEPNLLDLVALTDGFYWAGAQVTGFCAQAECRAFGAPAPRDWQMVSDHCPVVIEAR